MHRQRIEAFESIPNFGLVRYLEDRLDRAHATFGSTGYEILSARELAITLQGQRSLAMVGESAHVREAIVHFPQGPPTITKDSPLLASLTEVANAHEIEEEFYLNETEGAAIERMLAKDAHKAPEQRRMMRVNTTGHELHVVTTRFAEHPVTRFLFEDQAEVYGAFLWNTQRIPAMSFHFQRPYGSDASRLFACQAVMLEYADLTTYRHSFTRSQLVWGKRVVP